MSKTPKKNEIIDNKEINEEYKESIINTRKTEEIVSTFQTMKIDENIGAQEKLDYICKEHIKIEDSGISEEDINKIYRNFEIIKELTGIEKLGIEFIRKISKYNEREISNLQYLIAIKDLIGSSRIYRRIEQLITIDTNAIKKIGKIKEKLKKLIRYINEYDIEKLAKVDETKIDNIINNGIDIEKVTGNEINGSSELLLILEVGIEKIDEFIENKEVFDSLTGKGKYDIRELKRLLEINQEELSNITENKEKIKELTGKITLFNAEQIKILSKITTSGYENFIKNKADIEKLRYGYNCNDWFGAEVIMEFSKLNTNQIKELLRIKNELGSKIYCTEEIKYLVKFSENDFKTLKECTKNDPREIISECCTTENCSDIEIINGNILKVIKTDGTYEYFYYYNSIELSLEYKGNNKYSMHVYIESPFIAGKALKEIIKLIPEGGILSEESSLSGDSFSLLLKEYLKGGSDEYTIQLTGKKIYINDQGKNTEISKIITEKKIENDDIIFQTEAEENAQEIADKINELIKKLKEKYPSQKGAKISDAKVRYFEQTGTWGIEIPQIEIVKQKKSS